MKKTSLLLFICALCYLSPMAQVKEYKAGHIFYISLPDFLTKTSGINSSATIQFHNKVKGIWGFVVEDDKEDLKLAELNFSSCQEFYDDFIKDFLKDEEKRSISNPVSQKTGSTTYIECDASYYDKEDKTSYYYYVAIIETKDTYYKLICHCSLEEKDKYKSVFQKIGKSIRD